MSISPPTDIVLDVARAADPGRVQEAAAKLSAPGADPAAFGDAYRMAGVSVHMPLDARGTLTALQTDNAVSGAGKAGDPYKQFEAFVLRQFVETMMPSKSNAVFGKGNAGGIWKSMLADQVGTQVAKAGGLGIAKMLEAARPLHAAAPSNALSNKTSEI
ncbi:rod-binding protein [Methylobacterium sp. 37f]|uniref:rod-binding protein n=1 Tax=Methylobacterium sp. 37f TaxID=2817058 RepID=UPI001FFC6AF1|nr:rod-binding protein [Methylobacterium sp. 37f]MCK2053213.1 rod-binding protein [Methylobacterium sp. 37f]